MEQNHYRLFTEFDVFLKVVHVLKMCNSSYPIIVCITACLWLHNNASDIYHFDCEFKCSLLPFESQLLKIDHDICPPMTNKNGLKRVILKAVMQEITAVFI